MNHIVAQGWLLDLGLIGKISSLYPFHLHLKYTSFLIAIPNFILYKYYGYNGPFILFSNAIWLYTIVSKISSERKIQIGNITASCNYRWLASKMLEEKPYITKCYTCDK